MQWQPISLDELRALMEAELALCSAEDRAWFDQVAFLPEKWDQQPYGASDGFWAVAVHEDRVLWYNDIEDGFNVSRFDRRGEIPRDEYWCDQETIGRQLPLLRGDVGQGRRGPPQPLG